MRKTLKTAGTTTKIMKMMQTEELNKTKEQTYKNLLKHHQKRIVELCEKSNLDGAQISWILEREFHADIPIDIVEQFIWDLEDRAFCLSCPSSRKR